MFWSTLSYRVCHGMPLKGEEEESINVMISTCFRDDRVERLSDLNQAALADSDTSTNIRKTLAVGMPPGLNVQDMTFSWKVLGYTPCSASCLGGIQEAMIQCVRDYDQRIATPVLCMDKPQPDIATTRKFVGMLFVG